MEHFNFKTINHLQQREKKSLEMIVFQPQPQPQLRRSAIPHLCRRTSDLKSGLYPNSRVFFRGVS